MELLGDPFAPFKAVYLDLVSPTGSGWWLLEDNMGQPGAPPPPPEAVTPTPQSFLERGQDIHSEDCRVGVLEGTPQSQG